MRIAVSPDFDAPVARPFPNGTGGREVPAFGTPRNDAGGRDGEDRADIARLGGADRAARTEGAAR